PGDRAARSRVGGRQGRLHPSRERRGGGDPPHPRLGKSLSETHGMMLYEEDIMAAIAAMTGWSLETADDMRVAIIRSQDDAGALAGLERTFAAAAVATGVTESEATAVWRDLARFAAYSFNKAHA